MASRVCRSIIVLNILQTCVVFSRTELKSSLTFVIDDTLSMQKEIENVLNASDKIFDTVINSNVSQIENFIIVTFNDPATEVFLRVNTTDPYVFKKSLKSLHASGGGDCPEYAMSGIELGIRSSLLGSFLIVITDAIAADKNKFEEVKNLALDMEVQIVFLITESSCKNNSNINDFQLYEKLAVATSGQVFQLKKNHVQKILDYVASVVTSKKIKLAAKKFPPGKNNFNYTVDDAITDVFVSVSGDSPHVVMTGPDGEKVKTIDVVNLPKVKVVMSKEPQTGSHDVKVECLSKSTVTVLGTTNVNFQYGFSIIKPSSKKDTTNRPIPDHKSYVCVKLITKGENINLTKIQLLDMNDNVLLQEPVKIVNTEDQFYISEPILPPNDIFQIAIIGDNVDTRQPIRRVSTTLVEPQRNSFESIKDTPPAVNILGESKIYANYGGSLQLKCSVSGYPEPKIFWKDMLGSSLTFTVAPMKLPYEYITVLDIAVLTKNNTYLCKADNYFGSDNKSVEIEANSIFEVVNISEDKNVKYNKEETLYCRVNTIPPANITWYLNGKEIEANDDISTSPDRSSLVIKHMKPKLAGKFICEVRNEFKRHIYYIQLSVTGIEVPKIDKNITEIYVLKGSSVNISCRILKEKPTSTIKWFFRCENKDLFYQIEGFSENLHLENVNTDKVGTYKCVTTNGIYNDTHVIDLIVEYAPVIKDLNDTFEMIDVADKIINLPCPVDGLPLPRVTWSFNGIAISDEHHYYINRKNTLKFKLSLETSGVYTCEAVNKLGSAKKNVSVHVLESITIDMPKETNLNVVVGSKLMLTCAAKGYPPPAIRWSFISSETKNLKEYNVSGPLVLSRIQLSDEGSYICEAKNLEESASLEYSVHVEGPSASINSYTVLKEIKGVVGDRTIRIPCSATDNHTREIIWMKDGKVLNTANEFYSVDENDTLIVKNVIRDSAGIYSCNTAYETFNLSVKYIPQTECPSAKISLEEGTSAEVKCNVPHERTDQVWWFASFRKIVEGKLIFPNVTNANKGFYVCRVSNFYHSKTGSVFVDVGHRPRFSYDDNLLQTYSFDDENRLLFCSYSANPKAKVSWWLNNKKLSTNKMTYMFDDRVTSIGEYKCVAENKFGKIEKNLILLAKVDCLLDIQKDFDRYHPIVLNNNIRLTDFKIKFGYLAIPINQSVQFYCPGGFNKFSGTDVKAMCVKSKQFKINKEFVDFPKVKCVEGMQPVTLKTGQPCAFNNTEIIKVGIKIKGEFLEIYEICFYKALKMPLYTHHRLTGFAAGMKSTTSKIWLHSDFINYNVDEMYDCEQQKKFISNILGGLFYTKDKCCFAARQLVNEKDVAPGLPQLSTHSFLNVIPHWNSCNMKNWNDLEELLRAATKKIKRALSITTGISFKINFPGSKSDTYLQIKDKGGVKRLVPEFLWKVIKDYYTGAAVAIIQINVPDLHEDNANNYKICPDICSEIQWMKDIDWSDVKNGFIFCCTITEFESAFRYKARFSEGYEKILKYFEYF